MANILLVDDDKNCLNGMWRVFWLDGQHEAERFSSAEEALARAREQSFDVVIADYRMPGMDGVRFLQAFREIQPDACRILISSHADMGLFRTAMKEAKVHHVLEKPCEGFQLMNAVQEGLEQVSVRGEVAALRRELAALRREHAELLARVPELLK